MSSDTPPAENAPFRSRSWALLGLWVLAFVLSTRGGTSPREVALAVSLLGLGGLALLGHLRLGRRASRLDAERQEAQRESERRALFLNSLVEHAPLAIVALDPEHRIIVGNPAFCALFGYDREEVVDRQLDELISRGDSIEEARNLTQAVQQGESVNATVQRFHKSGTPLTLELTGVPMTEAGELVGIFAVYQDISDRIEALESLRESEARYRTLVEDAPEAIVIFDIDTGRFVDCNKEALHLFGYKRHELYQLGLIDVSPPAQADGSESMIQLRDRLQQAVDGRLTVFEWLHRNKTGDEIPCEVRLTSLPSERRTLVRGSVLDIRERILLQQQLRQAQRMEAVGLLAGGVAHDFNNLLTVIGGYCNLAMMRPDLPSGARDELNEIRRAGDSAGALTRQLLAFSRRQVMQPEEVDLNRVVLDMEDMLTRLMGELIHVSTNLDLSLDQVHIDPGQVEQVIVNLVVNARDAMPDGGDLFIETSNESGVPDTLGARAGSLSGPFVLLSVRDTGTGMDTHTMRYIFEPFFTTKERGKGTGLGLSTVYGIVHQCDGYIDVRSEPGTGAEFRVFLPASSELKVTAPHRAEPSTASGSEVVLVVEDEEMVRNLARNVLAESGFDVMTASDGDEAIELILRDRDRIDLLLTDLVLPGLTGHEIAQRVQPVVPDLKVLFMSGYAEDLVPFEKAAENGFSFLQKPFTPSGLVTKVREVLDVAPPTTSLAQPGNPR